MNKQTIFDYISSRRSVTNINEKQIKDALQVIIDTVNAVNSCTEYDKSVGGTRLDQLYLPSWVKPFIYPVKVSVLPGYKYPDLVYRPEAKPDFRYSEKDVREAAFRIAATQKLTESLKFSTAEEMRGSEAVMSNVNFSVDKRVDQKDNAVFYPVPLNNSVKGVLGEEWSNMDAEQVISAFYQRSFTFRTE